MELKQTQLELETLYHKNQAISRISKEFRNLGAYTYAENVGVDPDFTIKLLAQITLHRRAKPEVLVAILHTCFGPKGDPAAMQACADELTKAALADFVDVDPLNQEIVIRCHLPAEIQAEIDQFQYPLPMIIEPQKLKTNSDTGYISVRGSVILKDNHHWGDVCLDHINRSNAIKLSINLKTVQMVQNSWKDLDHQREDEDFDSYQKRVKAFEKYDRNSRGVIEAIAVLDPEAIYLTHKYDKRGRTYAQGYHINTQGNDWNKSIIELADKELVE